jgi:hypothetical protein
VDDTPRMTSIEKVRAVAARIDELEPDNAQATAAVLAMTALRPQALALLPDDPAELDELLVKGALWALSLRSDDAAPLEVAVPGAGRLGATT